MRNAIYIFDGCSNNSKAGLHSRQAASLFEESRRRHNEKSSQRLPRAPRRMKILKKTFQLLGCAHSFRWGGHISSTS